MALSGSTNFNANRYQIVTSALRICGAIAAGDTAAAEDVSDADLALNMMLKSWQSDGLHLFTRRRVSLLLELNKSKYTLSTSGDFATYTENLNETTVRVAGVATDTTLEVTTTSGMAAGDYFAIVQDDGTLHKTTITSVTDSDTVVITDALTDDVAIGNQIWWFTNKIDRPNRVLQAFVRDSSDLDTIVSCVTQQEYWSLSKKSTDGRVNQVYYDPQYNAGHLYVWPESDVTTSTLELIVQKPFDDLDVSTNNVEFPTEWLNAIKFNLALMLSYEYGLSGPTIDRIERRAMMEKGNVLSFDQESGSLYLQPGR